jgi:hypothetical protein
MMLSPFPPDDDTSPMEVLWVDGDKVRFSVPPRDYILRVAFDCDQGKVLWRFEKPEGGE